MLRPWQLAKQSLLGVVPEDEVEYETAAPNSPEEEAIMARVAASEEPLTVAVPSDGVVEPAYSDVVAATPKANAAPPQTAVPEGTNGSVKYVWDIKNQMDNLAQGRPTDDSRYSTQKVEDPKVQWKEVATPKIDPLDMTPHGGPMPALSVEEEPDWMAEAQAARGKASQMHLIAGIGRAGEKVNAALSGTKSDGSGYAPIDAQAREIEGRVGDDMKLGEMSRKYRDQQALRDPRSPVSQRARAMTPGYVVKAFGAGFDQASAADIEKIRPGIEKAALEDLRMKVSMGNMGIRADTANNDFKFKAADQTLRATAESNEAADIARKTDGLSPQERQQTFIDDRKVDADMIKFGETMNAESPAISRLYTLDKEAPGLLTEEAGSEKYRMELGDRLKNLAPGGLGSRLTSKQKIAVQSAVNELVQEFRKGNFGSAVTEPEMVLIKEIAGNGLLSDPQVQVEFLKHFGQRIAMYLDFAQTPLRQGRGSLAAKYKEQHAGKFYDVETSPLFRKMLNRPPLTNPSLEAPRTAPPTRGNAPPAPPPPAAVTPRTLKPQEQGLLDWANKNPGPKADAIRKKLGVQ